jgi:hypothetical protein
MRADHPSEPARHAAGRRLRRRGLSAALLRARFRAAALVPAAVLGLSGGAVVAWAAPGPLAWQAAPDASATTVDGATPGPQVAALGGADGSRSAEAGRTAPPTSVASPEPSPTAVPVPDPNAVDPAGLTLADREAGLTSLAVPTSATGDLLVAPGSVDPPNPAAARVVRVRVEVESGLDIDPARFAATVLATLNDPRGWGADGSVSFARTDGDADLRVVLASPDTIDDLCAPLETVGRYSCGRNGHAALNHTRWVQGTDDFADVVQYREYLVNHEVGHLLGHGHVECPAAGAVAPVMQQQTVGVAPCVPNGWPFP